MENTKVKRIVLKENDVLLLKLPRHYFRSREGIKQFYENIRKRLLPKKNKILMLPEDVDISVIGENEVQEYISNIDIWSLWNENDEEE